MADEVSKESPRAHSWKQWAIGIPVSLVTLVLLLLFVQPWGQPRESVTSTAPRDGDFYDPTAEQPAQETSRTFGSEDIPSSELETSLTSGPRIVDVNLASWKPVDESTVAAADLPTISNEVEGQVLVEISADLWTKVAGDPMQFAIPQREEVLTGTITTVNNEDARTRILEGKLKDGPQEYKFVLTLGPASTYANIITATGTFELVGTRDYGWLMASSDMTPKIEYSLPDHSSVDLSPHDRALESESSPANDD